MPGLGAIGRPAGSDTATDVFFSFQSFTRPRTVYRHDVATGETEVWREPELPFDPSAYETRQVHYPSKDGTQVPMFLTHRKGSEPAGDQPTLLYGYGGFNIPITPRFKVANLLWIEMGGLYASANLRGGGEFGREWHEAGTKQQKQNVFDDFIAAGEYLVSEGWTQPERMAIHGRSNGGLLVGATLLQRPDLFGAAIPSVGVLDMLRYHKFTIGWAWASDYGTSEDSAEMFQYLRAYSPVHNAEAGAYPATLITTADHDDRVVPSHSFKFAAALQEAQEGDAPILIRIETRAGHGAGTPIPMLIDEEADKLAFLLDALGAEPEGGAPCASSSSRCGRPPRPAGARDEDGRRRRRACPASPHPTSCPACGTWPPSGWHRARPPRPSCRPSPSSSDGPAGSASAARRPPRRTGRSRSRCAGAATGS
jgi:prolyl oligopeptidase